MHVVVVSTGARIEVAKPVVELDGDEMTRIIWARIKERVRIDSNTYLDPNLILNSIKVFICEIHCATVWCGKNKCIQGQIQDSPLGKGSNIQF